MRKSFIFVITLGLFTGLAGFSSTAQADYSISIGYNTGRQYNDRNSYYHHNNKHYPRAHYYQPRYSYYPVIIQKRVVYEQERQANTTAERFGISDVIVLSKGGVSDNVIIEKIRRTGSVFSLSAEEVEVLRKEGVSARVVNYMLNTSR